MEVEKIMRTILLNDGSKACNRAIKQYRQVLKSQKIKATETLLQVRHFFPRTYNLQWDSNELVVLFEAEIDKCL